MILRDSYRLRTPNELNWITVQVQQLRQEGDVYSWARTIGEAPEERRVYGHGVPMMFKAP